MGSKETAELVGLLNKPAMDDVIATIVAYSGLEVFLSDRKRLHAFVKELRDSGSASRLLEEAVFSQGADLYPFSRALENCLVRLQLGGLIYAKNPEYDRYGITRESREKTLRKATERFTADELKLLKDAGAAMRKELS